MPVLSRRTAFAWFFLSVIGLPQEMIWIGFPASFREHDFSRARFRGCSYFVMFRPHSLLASQVAPTAASYHAGRPRLLRIIKGRPFEVGFECNPELYRKDSLAISA